MPKPTIAMMHGPAAGAGLALAAACDLRIGLVNRVVPDAALEAETTKIAQQIADGPRIANRYIKSNLNAAEADRLEAVFDLEAQHLTRTRMTADHQEAARAFIEKRPPVFKGK